ncbi:MAG: FAD-dependent monooxygenase, partial [Thermodesulfobacteriota bacterium]
CTITAGFPNITFLCILRKWSIDLITEKKISLNCFYISILVTFPTNYLVLWPSGSRILKGLGIYRKLLDAGLPLSTYNVWNEKGEMLHSYSVRAVTDKYGPMISIYRPDLINVLREAVDSDTIRMNTTVDKIHQTGDEVHVTFSDGKEEAFDLVVGCDGVHSETRNMVFGDVPATYSGMRGGASGSSPAS